MRDPKRIRPILNRLADVWERNPDLRLGQLLVAAVGGDPFYVEDDALIAAAERELGAPASREST